MPAGTSSIGPLDGLLEKSTRESIQPTDSKIAENISTQLELLRFVSESDVSEEEIAGLARQHIANFFTQNQRGFSKVSISANDSCNLRCRHCYYEGTHVPHFEKNPPLNLEQWKKVINDLSDKGYKRFCISGKEPLVTPIATQSLVEYISKHPEAQLDLLTNGTLIAQNLDWLQNGATLYGISIDGDETSHDVIRGEGNYQKTKKGIEKLVKLVSSNRIVVNSTLMSHNFESLVRGIKDIHSIGARFFKIGGFFPTVYNSGSILEPSYEDFDKLCRGLKELEIKDGGAITAYLIPEENAPIIVGMYKAGLFDRDKLIEAEKRWKNLLGDLYIMLPVLNLPLDDSGRISVTVKTLPTNFYGNFRLHPNGEVGDLCIDLSNPDYMANNLGNIFTEGLDTILGKMQQAFEAHSRVFYRNFREEFKGQHSNNVKKTY